MTPRWRLVWTIARRDYRAAVMSRLFLLFLVLPLVVGGVGIAFGAIGANEAPPNITVAVAGPDLAALQAARARLSARLGDDALPILVSAEGAADDVARLTGGIAHPRLRPAPRAERDVAGPIALLIDEVRRTRVLGAAAPPPVKLAIDRAPAAPRGPADGRRGLAHGVQYALLVLTMMLAGRLLSSFIEERSNKVIEVLAAAVPVDAIFLGKLLAMLLFSLTCVLAWGAILLGGALLLAPALLAGAAVPAVGWPAFVLLTLAYFVSTYLLLGAVLLGLGAQASSPADVQTLALPTTIVQLLLFAFASLGVGRPEHVTAVVAALFPWSSALAMAARAAERPALWTHGLAILWQALWVWLTIRVAAARFRRAVLKTGRTAAR